MHDGDRRGNSRARGYTTAWDKSAATFKQRNPHCRGCKALGRMVATEVVDHVEPHKGDQRKFWDTAMWQASCRWHHDVVKPRLERMFADGDIAIAELWLDSPTALQLSRRHPARVTTGLDGWPEG